MRRFFIGLAVFVAIVLTVAALAVAQVPDGFTRTEVKSGGMLSLSCEEVYGLNPKRLASAPCWEGAKHPDGTVVANPDFIFPGEFDLPAPPYDLPFMAPAVESVPDTLTFPVIEEGPLFSPNPFANPADQAYAVDDAVTYGFGESVGTSVPMAIHVPTVDVLGTEFNLAWLITIVIALAVAGSMAIDAFRDNGHASPARQRHRAK